VSRIKALCPPEKQAGGATPLRIIGMIESAEAMVKIREIAASGRGHLDALLVSTSQLDKTTLQAEIQIMYVVHFVC
jgi:citrate lyase subunit beta-like protein